MRIDKLWISKFKNLQDFEIDFDKDELISVIVGRNGTGKSNVLEALVIVFRDLDLGKDPQFAYELVYQIANYEVHIDADPERYKESKRTTKDFYHIRVRKVDSREWENLNISRFSGDDSRRYLPRYVFGYYSGPSNRLEYHFQEHQERFYRELINQKPDDDVPPLRPLLYARLIHSQFALLAFFLEHDTNVIRFLENQLLIVGLDSVLFILKTPKWANNQKQRDHLFWTARGTVRVFMERLYELALAPFKWSVSKTEDYLYMYIKDQDSLQELARKYLAQEQRKVGETSYQAFFKALESTYISDLIHEVRIKVKIKNVDGSLTFRELSEGEQQLLMVLGLMRFTKENESIFLLDEPDTHLNPAWSVDYLNFIRESHEKNIVGLRENSQVIITTHNPMTIAGLLRKQINVINRDDEDGTISASLAEEDAIGMGVDGILTSDIFGLRSTLDRETLDLLDKKRILAAKEETLTEAEREALADINEKLENMRFTKTSPDPLYEPIAEALAVEEQEAGLQMPVLSKEQQKARKELAKKVLRRVKEERQSE